MVSEVFSPLVYDLTRKNGTGAYRVRYVVRIYAQRFRKIVFAYIVDVSNNILRFFLMMSISAS